MFRLHITRYFGFALAICALFGSDSLNANIIHVPTDQPTIQAGIDAAIPGDTVLVADGTYTGLGNRDIDFHGKGILLKSENGPEVTIIDCQGTQIDRHRGFYFHSGEDSSAVVDGFTIEGGYGLADGPFGSAGGGIKCDSSSSPKIINNIISGNSADGFGGGGIYCSFSSSPIISNNTISGNSATSGGGIVCISNSSPTISNNTIIDNSAQAGGGIFCFGFSSPVIINNIIKGNSAIGISLGGGIHCLNSSNATINNNTIIENSALTGAGLFSGLNSHPSLENSIIAFNSGGEAVSCDDNSGPSLTCCDIFGNQGGDWVGCIANQATIDGNFSANPLFCDTANDVYHLSSFSPCLAQNSPCGKLVGALGEGCPDLYICADANGDSLVTQDDIAFLQTYYSQCGTAPFPLPASDVNCDGIVDIQDIIYLATYLNANGPAPCCQ